MKFCKRCLYSSDHPLGIVLDGDGICSGCRIHEEKNKLDWDYRKDKLQRLVKTYKTRKDFTYDCIVPVSGGNDSFFIMHIVKNILGLNPLMVTYNKYYNTSLGIRNLALLRSSFNSDILVQNINPLSVKKITKETLRRFGSIYWHCLAGQTVFPVQIAVKYKIPLIIWGAHQGIEQVGMFSHEDEVEMTRRYRKDHDLMGFEADDLLEVSNNLTENDIWQYRYPNDNLLNSIGVRGIYLSNFFRWDSKAQHELMIKKYKYKTSLFARTFENYDHTDCFNYLDLHDYLKLCKHGYSKVTDHACREIRYNRLTRSQGLSLVKQYELIAPKFLDLFSDWLNINLDSFNFIFNQFRNKKYWIQDKPSHFIFNGLSSNQSVLRSSKDEKLSISYVENSNLFNKGERKYIIYGKGC